MQGDGMETTEIPVSPEDEAQANIQAGFDKYFDLPLVKTREDRINLLPQLDKAFEEASRVTASELAEAKPEDREEMFDGVWEIIKAGTARQSHNVEPNAVEHSALESLHEVVAATIQEASARIQRSGNEQAAPAFNAKSYEETSAFFDQLYSDYASTIGGKDQALRDQQWDQLTHGAADALLRTYGQEIEPETVKNVLAINYNRVLGKGENTHGHFDLLKDVTLESLEIVDSQNPPITPQAATL